MKRNLNWKRSPKDERDRMFHREFSLMATLPKLVDNSHGMGPVRNQDQLGCCVGEGSVAAVEYMERQYGTDMHFEGSELYAYYNARVDKHSDTGAMVRDSIKAMSKLGICRLDLWPFDQAKFSTKPPSESFADGPNQKITEYLKAVTLNDIRQALAGHHVVVGGFDCPASLDSEGTIRTGIVRTPRQGEALIGGHCVCFTGYDDVKRLLKFKNSWSTQWGDMGYGYLEYGFFPHYADDCWVLIK